MAKRKITGRDVLKDIKAGMDDPALMDKYKLSSQGLQSVFSKLVNAGVLTEAELDSRVPISERTVDLGLYICPACGNIQAREFTECSRCGFVSPAYIKQQKEKEAQEKARKQPPGRKLFSRARSKERAQPGSALPEEQDSHNLEQKTVGPRSNLARIIRYCNGLAVAALAVYFLVIVGLFAIIQTSPAAELFTAVQLLLAALVLGLPALIMALIVFLAMRALTESIRVFVGMADQISGAQQ
ncbi:MAG: hypothetical protein HY913_06975 [Desulfomonile tiedjei]|nr:hypothetical protein [Desulfomonile tiedjei]